VPAPVEECPALDGFRRRPCRMRFGPVSNPPATHPWLLPKPPDSSKKVRTLVQMLQKSCFQIRFGGYHARTGRPEEPRPLLPGTKENLVP
jgi:hypothetical protein